MFGRERSRSITIWGSDALLTEGVVQIGDLPDILLAERAEVEPLDDVSAHRRRHDDRL